ncbi:hypothetical protein P4S95_02080 [Aneurinibacillus aneurinilyticus]|uniref:hypothetical protein n=1 Tax=Aneurinibacillus aneurinilyticus TaxID=1391 RepID=UPI002E1CD5A0|nr:hypothetical protein [Aneurinibacillus aneurinilyticus]
MNEHTVVARGKKEGESQRLGKARRFFSAGMQNVSNLFFLADAEILGGIYIAIPGAFRHNKNSKQ